MRRQILFALVITTAVPVRAEPTVLAVDGADIYVELGARDGVGANSVLELHHEVVVRDPRTGATLRDRFPLGTLIVIKSGDRISVATTEPALAKRVLPGDRVKLVSGARTFVDPWQQRLAESDASAPAVAASGAPQAPSTPSSAPDHVALAGAAWRETLGKPIDERIARWQQLIAADPRSPYRRLVETEIASLQQQRAAREAALARARSTDVRDTNARVAALARELQERGSLLLVAPIEQAVVGAPIDLAFTMRQPAQIGEAWLYVRSEGAPGYTRQPLVRDGDAYLRATIPATQVTAGALAWYVEARVPGADGGEVEPVLGSHRRPEVIEVDSSVIEEPVARGRSHIDAHVDYVDFDGELDNGFDQYYQAELGFTYRFLEPVYAVRLGFGTLSGIGGPKDVIDEDATDQCLDASGTYRCKRVDFTYVYTELEFRLRPTVALMLRPTAGVLTTDEMPVDEAGRCRDAQDLAGCRFETGFGLRARVRFGAEDATNLVLGASFTEGVGTLFEAAYHWLPVRAIPVQLHVQVTDQPLPEDFGVRLIGDVGWRSLSWFYPSLRVSYQARDIDHGGVSGGFAANFDW